MEGGGGRDGERPWGPGKMQSRASQDGTGGAAAPVIVADWVLSSGVGTACAAGARTVFIPHRRRSERGRHLPEGTQLGTGSLEFKPKAVGLQSPIS